MIKRNKIKWAGVISLVLLLTLVFVPAALAFDDRTGADIVIPAGEIVEDDLYASGDTITIDGTVKGDLIGFAGKITINGTVEGDLLGAAREIEINGTVKDDVRAAAYALTLSPGAVVGSDFVGAAYHLGIYKDSTIGQSLLYAGFQAVISGKITRDAKLVAEGLDFKGEIGRNADFYLGSKADHEDRTFNPGFDNMPQVPNVGAGLNASSGAKIGGSLTYTAKEEGVLPDGVVSGEVTHLLPKVETDRPSEATKSTPASMAMAWGLDSLRFLISLAMIGLLAIWLIPGWVKNPASQMEKRPLVNLGWGFVSHLGFWAAISIFLALVILLGGILALLTLGWLSAAAIVLGITGWAALIVIFLVGASYFALVIFSYWLGRALLLRTKPELAEKDLWILLVGILIVGIFAAIPVIGWIVKIGGALLGLGALVALVLEQRKNKNGTAAESTTEITGPILPA